MSEILMAPAVSVVILCYNHQKYIHASIKSVLSQSFDDLEILVVDDGSTDNSRKIINTIRDPRLRLITKKNGGPSDATTLGIQESKAPLIAIMSGDDICRYDRIEIQIDELNRYNADIVFCQPSLIDEEGRSLPDSAWPIFFKRTFTSQAELYRTLFFHGNFLCAPSAIFKSSIIDKHNYMHNGLLQLQDFFWWVQLAPHTSFYCSNERYLSYRIREKHGNLSSKSNKWRTRFEKAIVYRRFFDGASREFLQETFGNAISPLSDDIVFEAEKAKLLLQHKDPVVKIIGAEILIDLLQTRENALALEKLLNITLSSVHRDVARFLNKERFSLIKKLRLFFN